jgi:archaellum component FlaC
LKLVNDVFTELIYAQRNRQDAQSLQMIKEFYLQEISSQRGQASAEVERERGRRREVERMVERLGDEVKRLQGLVDKKEVNIASL